jgi:ribonuclease HI
VQRNKVIDPSKFRGIMDGASVSSRHRMRIPLVYSDRAWGSTGVGAVAMLTSPSGIKLCYATKLQFTGEIDKCTNNIVEYEAILLGLQKLRAISVQTCVFHTDSKVVSGQIEKE